MKFFYLLIFLCSCNVSEKIRNIELIEDVKYLENDFSDFDDEVFIYDSRRNTFISKSKTITHPWGVETIAVTLLPDSIKVKNDTLDTHKDGYLVNINNNFFRCRNIIK